MYQQLWSITGAMALIFIVSSCGSRKREVARKKTDKVSALYHKATGTRQQDIETRAIMTRKGHTVTYTPVDPGQPILTEDENGKRRQIQNAVITVKQSKEERQVHQTERSETQTAVETGKRETYRQEENHNHMERKEPFIPWYVWIFTVALLVLMVFPIRLKR